MRGHTHVLMVCQLAAMCPYAAVREDFMKALCHRQQSGSTVIAGAEVLAIGQSMTFTFAACVLQTMAKVQGDTLHALPHT